MRKFATAQVARTLATLLGGGIPLVNAIEIGGRSMSNRHLARELDDVRRRVQEGQSFAAALRERASFPDVAVKMVEVGESTGALQDMLNTVADFYDEEIATTMDRFVTLVEPVLLVFMGVVIAGLLLAIPSLWFGAALNWNVDAPTLQQTANIQVYERLAHHLAPATFQTGFISRHLLLWAFAFQLAADHDARQLAHGHGGGQPAQESAITPADRHAHIDAGLMLRLVPQQLAPVRRRRRLQLAESVERARDRVQRHAVAVQGSVGCPHHAVEVLVERNENGAGELRQLIGRGR